MIYQDNPRSIKTYQNQPRSNQDQQNKDHSSALIASALFGYTLRISFAYLKHMLGIFLEYNGHILGISWVCKGISGTYLRNVFCKYSGYLEHILAIF